MKYKTLILSAFLSLLATACSDQKRDLKQTPVDERQESAMAHLVHWIVNASLAKVADSPAKDGALYSLPQDLLRKKKSPTPSLNYSREITAVVVLTGYDKIAKDSERKKKFIQTLHAVAGMSGYIFKDEKGVEQQLSLLEFDVDIVPGSLIEIVVVPTLVSLVPPQKAEGHMSEDDAQVIINKQIEDASVKSQSRTDRIMPGTPNLGE